MLPKGDHTPDDYRLPSDKATEAVKRPLRKIAYPVYNSLLHPFLARRYTTTDFQPDLWLWGQRGNDFQRHRRQVSRFLPIKDQKILIAGCGTGQDIESWVCYRPRLIEAIDWFSYTRAWAMWKDRYSDIAPDVEVSFYQTDLAHLQIFQNDNFDIVSSDAVFEHIKNLPEVLQEFGRLLRPGGIIYSTFGPLWYSWGGDHVSGYDDIGSGYNHLLLEQDAYREYLYKMGAYRHSEHDGRTWIKNDMFSRLTARQYLQLMDEAGFQRLFVSAIIDPKAVTCLRDRKLKEKLLERFDYLDLLISGLTVIYEQC